MREYFADYVRVVLISMWETFRYVCLVVGLGYLWLAVIQVMFVFRGYPVDVALPDGITTGVVVSVAAAAFMACVWQFIRLFSTEPDIDAT